MINIGYNSEQLMINIGYNIEQLMINIVYNSEQLMINMGLTIGIAFLFDLCTNLDPCKQFQQKELKKTN